MSYAKEEKQWGPLYVGSPTEPVYYLSPPRIKLRPQRALLVHQGELGKSITPPTHTPPPTHTHAQEKAKCISQNLEQDEGKHSLLRIHKPQADLNVGFLTKFTLLTCPRSLNL